MEEEEEKYYWIEEIADDIVHKRNSLRKFPLEKENLIPRLVFVSFFFTVDNFGLKNVQYIRNIPLNN